MRSSLAILLLPALLAAPLRGEEDAATVFAAASLGDVVSALDEHFEGGQLRTSFGASSELARQIRDGAPADVFLSASREWVEFLREAGRVEGDPLVFARGELVCIAPEGGRLRERGVVDAASLLEKGLSVGDRVAIADAGVPAGEYARQALASAGLAEGYRARLVGRKDVRAVLHAVERGELAAGFVYATDARAAGVDVVFAFDPASHAPIEYLAVAVRDAPRSDAARRFLAFLRSEAARGLLAEAGFLVP